AILIAASFNVAASVGAAAESGTLLTGKAAMGDWKGDSPGLRRKITVADLPPPGSNALAINFARVIASGRRKASSPARFQDRVVRQWFSRSSISADRTEW